MKKEVTTRRRPVTDFNRAMSRAYPDLPWFRIERETDGPGNTGATSYYTVLVQGRNMPEGFKDLLRKAVRDSKGGWSDVQFDKEYGPHTLHIRSEADSARDPRLGGVDAGAGARQAAQEGA